MKRLYQDNLHQLFKKKNAWKKCSHHYLKNYKAIAVKVCLTFKLRTVPSPIPIPGKEAWNRSFEAKF
jgi:hypothetical protein